RAGSAPRRARRVVLACSIATATLVSVSLSGLDTAATASPGCTLPSSVSAAPDTTLQSQFSAYADAATGTSWTGGDGPHSTTLPDGRTLWFFDDTFLGTVSAKGLRNRAKAPILRNSIVLQDPTGSLEQTLYQTVGTKPAAYVSPAALKRATLGYWPNSLEVVGNELYVLMTEYSFKQNAFSFVRLGDFLAEFDLPSLTLHAMTALPASPIQWTQWVLHDGSSMYAYGYANGNAYVAQVDPTTLSEPWLFYDGSGWSPDATQAAPIGSAAEGFSVTKQGDAYVLVSLTASTAVGNSIVVSYSCSATGPFGPSQPVYNTPDHAQYPATWNVITYDAHVQPAIDAGPDSLVISYDVNAPGSKRALAVAALYRPRYVTLTFG
ncbi:MAG TPA: DUF5005 domain-containing protein, partial [Acidimicrobiales bacterium]|nr:DUF5005 domain-containing protein [Acidimicrobiales bacterium]